MKDDWFGTWIQALQRDALEVTGHADGATVAYRGMPLTSMTGGIVTAHVD